LHIRFHWTAAVFSLKEGKVEVFDRAPSARLAGRWGCHGSSGRHGWNLKVRQQRGGQHLAFALAGAQKALNER
jgi:hypothetical protein